jgi:methylenetetrahydrofolate dehydrogenase (NADP+) / methenyltetrahydrofolate cyclohydrolase / formyltetrahydrofolate synthetase
LETIRLAALEAGAVAAVPSWHWGEGGKGAIDLAKAVVSTCNADTQSFRFLYDLKTSIEEKIETISKEIYGADGIELSDHAQKKVKLYENQVDPWFCPFLMLLGIRTPSCLHRKNSVFLLN